ncbi:preprotein translocase, SecY subunit [Batrachochytrium salamandrivorans]|nr:preprotein translocase, SecY subunit [Batrachochytrium salamandrivorans]
MVRFIELMRPLSLLTVKVSDPPKKQTYQQRLLYTLIVLLVFLILGQVPLFGLEKQVKSDPFYWMRTVMASNKGTLMELGISPIITSGMVIQLMQGARIIHVNMNVSEDRALLKMTTKFFGILLTFGQAFVYVYSGAYGNISDLGLIKASLVVLQLGCAGILLVLMDEMLGKGYGLSQGGISLFIAVNVAEHIVWKCFSPITVNTGKGAEFEGAIVALFHLVLSRSNKLQALREAFFRTSAPNLMSVIATVLVFALVVFLQGFKVDLKMTNVRERGRIQYYPIKLFYTSNIPVILQAALIQNVNLISELLYRKFNQNVLVRLLGRWAQDERTGAMHPVGGFAYYLSPPHSLGDVASDPFHFVFYFVFVVSACALFARTWVEVSPGSSPREIAKNLKDNGWVIRDGNKSMLETLTRTIPVASAFGGGVIGALTIVADLAGALGSGTGLLLAISIFIGIYDSHVQETKAQ